MFGEEKVIGARPMATSSEAAIAGKTAVDLITDVGSLIRKSLHGNRSTSEKPTRKLRNMRFNLLTRETMGPANLECHA